MFDDDDKAVLVLAKTMSINILSYKMRQIYFRRLVHPGQTVAIKAEERRTSMYKRHSRWENSLKGRETFHLVSDITPWMENGHCELNYYVNQFLTGHVCFRKYLHRIEHDTFLIYPNCADEEDEDAEHILTCCLRFRWPGETSLGPNWLMEEVLDSMVPIQRMAGVMLELPRLLE